MTEALAMALVRRAAAISDAKARVAWLRSILPGLDPDELREALTLIQERAGARETAAQIALLALAEALEHDRLAAAKSAGAGPAIAAVAGKPGAAQGNDWGTGRPLTLGERKSLARRPERRLLERALRDEHPDVVAQVLQNPRLTENDVVRLCAAPTARPAALERVFAAPRWARLPRVRRALAANPNTPEPIALAVLPLLAGPELREIAADPRLPDDVRDGARRVLRQRAARDA